MLTTALDGALFMERYGTSSPAVLALHGWARDRRDWDPLLKDRSDAIAVDLPGFGLSPAPSAAWGAADYARCVQAAFPDPAGLVVVGHSFGGRVAVELAVQRPDLVRGLVLTGVPLLRVNQPGRPKPAYRAARALHRRGLFPEARMEALRRRYGSSDYRAASGTMRDVLVRTVNEDYREQLRAITAPVWLVWGAQDTSAPLAVAEEAAGLLGTAQLRVAPESGHLLDRPLGALLATAIDEALAYG